VAVVMPVVSDNLFNFGLPLVLALVAKDDGFLLSIFSSS
jgi:hypothetical protein